MNKKDINGGCKTAKVTFLWCVDMECGHNANLCTT